MISIFVFLYRTKTVSAKPHDKFWIVGEPKVLLVNTKNGGEGALNILSNKIDLETKIEKNMDGLYTAILTPKTEGQHRIVLIYGGVHIPGGTVDFEVSLLKLNLVY